MLDYDSLTEEQINDAIEQLARKVVARRLETPAILLLELHRPVSFLAGQAAVVGAPFLAPILGIEAISRYGAVLNDRRHLDRLIQRIEELASETNRDTAQEQVG